MSQNLSRGSDTLALQWGETNGIFIHALAQRRFPRYLIDIHRAGEIELALYTVDRFKSILADTQKGKWLLITSECLSPCRIGTLASN